MKNIISLITGWDCAYHNYEQFKKSTEWNGRAVAHLALAAIECLPVIGAIVAIFDRMMKSPQINPPQLNLAEVMTQTEKIVNTGYYVKNQVQVPIKKAEEISIYASKNNTVTSRKINLTSGTAEPAVSTPLNPATNHSIEVRNGDCIDISKSLIDEGRKVALLDAANEHHPGGSPFGARAQEEQICRRSNLYPALVRAKNLLDQQGSFIQTNEALFIKDIVIFRGSANEGYPFLDTPFPLPIIASAALDLNSLQDKYPVALDRSTGKYVPQNWSSDTVGAYKEITKAKLRSIFSAAIANGLDTLVLVPFGCGAFRNPQDLMIECMAEIHAEFRQNIKVVLSVLNDSNGKKNYEIFQALEAKTGKNNLLVPFYRGTGPDAEGRYLKDLWDLDDNAKESCHNYIQWLFPNKIPSKYNSKAPILSQESLKEMNQDPEIRANIKTSFYKMLSFYGLHFDEQSQTVILAANFKERSAVWLTPSNHNFLRITRILNCLVNFGYLKEAEAFYKILITINAQHNDVCKNSLAIWERAAKAN